MDDLQPERAAGGRFAAGNPGRPKGARGKLGEAFLTALLTDFAVGGVEAIQRVRDSDPSTYMRVVAGLMPKEVTGEEGAQLFAGITVSFVKPGEK